MSKNDKLRNALSTLATTELFHNDGNGHLYFYNMGRGIFEELSPIKIRGEIEKALTSKGFYDMNTGDYKKIQENLKESVRFFNKNLEIVKPSMFIGCKNGAVNLRDGSLTGFNKNLFLRNSLDFEYIKNLNLSITSETFRFLKSFLGVEKDLEKSPKFSLLLEILGYSISNICNAKKAFILLGGPNIGKSLLLDMIGKVVGENTFTSLSWGNITDKYYAGTIINKALILSDEMPSKPLMHLEQLKTIISGGRIVIDKKFGEIQDYKPRVKLISAANSMPVLGEPDVGDAFVERLTVLCLNKVKPERKDPELGDKLWAERDVLFSLATQKMRELLENNLVFTEDPEGQRLCEQLKKEGNSVNDFIKNYFEENVNGKIVGQEFYEKYCNFCEDALLKPLYKNDFKIQVTQMGYKFKKVRIAGYNNPRLSVLGLSLKTPYADPE